MLLLTLLLYLLSTLYWAYSVAEVADRLRSFIDLPFNTLNTITIPEQDAVIEWLPLANAFILMNVSSFVFYTSRHSLTLDVFIS